MRGAQSATTPVKQKLTSERGEAKLLFRRDSLGTLSLNSTHTRPLKLMHARTMNEHILACTAASHRGNDRQGEPSRTDTNFHHSHLFAVPLSHRHHTKPSHDDLFAVATGRRW
jgi:hypothetical protein